jgi:hypothetical protein
VLQGEAVPDQMVDNLAMVGFILGAHLLSDALKLASFVGF